MELLVTGIESPLCSFEVGIDPHARPFQAGAVVHESKELWVLASQLL
jgi:hypothetical protein